MEYRIFISIVGISVNLKNIDINIDKAILKKNIDINKGVLQNIDMAILKNIDIDKDILGNVDFDIDNRCFGCIVVLPQSHQSNAL